MYLSLVGRILMELPLENITAACVLIDMRVVVE